MFIHLSKLPPYGWYSGRNYTPLRHQINNSTIQQRSLNKKYSRRLLRFFSIISTGTKWYKQPSLNSKASTKEIVFAMGRGVYLRPLWRRICSLYLYYHHTDGIRGVIIRLRGRNYTPLRHHLVNRRDNDSTAKSQQKNYSRRSRRLRRFLG